MPVNSTVYAYIPRHPYLYLTYRCILYCADKVYGKLEKKKMPKIPFPTMSEKKKSPPASFPTLSEEKKSSLASFPTLSEEKKTTPASFPTLSEEKKSSLASFPTLSEEKKTSSASFPTLSESLPDKRAYRKTILHPFGSGLHPIFIFNLLQNI